MAFTIVALSLLLLMDISRSWTLIFVVGIPVLFGYTAYISHDSFKKESLASSIGFVFIPLGGIIAASTVAIFVFNVFVSFFASGKSFRSYYSSTALPLLLVGLLIGGSLASFALYSPSFESQLEETFIDQGADRTMDMIELTGVGMDQEEALRNATYSNVVITENYVVNEYAQRTENPDIEALRNVFDDAKKDIPEAVVNKSKESESPDRRARVEDALGTTISGKVPLVILVFSVTMLYALQPLIGLLTACSALMFKGLRSMVSES